MRTLILAMAMASTLLTPAIASAADRPGNRAERRADRRTDVAHARVERRSDVRRDRAKARGNHRRVARINRQERRADRRIDRREDRAERRIDRRVAERRWNRQWRNDRRYDYARYRRANRAVYRAPRYVSPYRNRGYSRLTIGGGIGSGYYGSRYGIANPSRYRLPPAYGVYRWTRYYNDAVLVDTRRGIVADVLYDFFY